MSQILNRIREVDANNSEAVKECVTLFFQNLLKQSDSNRWLSALDDVICRFPKYCISHRSTAETYIVSLLDTNNYYNAIQAAKCAHSLQQVRPSQEKAATPKSSWRNLMSLLCSVAHNLLNKLFPKTFKTHRNDLKNQIKELPNTPLTEALKKLGNVSEKESSKKKILFTRLKNVFTFIQAMLVEPYPVAKPIQPQVILDIIVHTLSIAQSAKDSIADIVQIKIDALRTLDALVLCLGPHLIPYSPLVFRLVMQTLRWTSENPCDETRSVRCGAYNSLRQWLTMLHAHKMADNRASLEDELTTHIINDITPPKKVVQLTMGPQPTKNMSKKAKRKLATTQLQESSLAIHMPGDQNKNNKCEESVELAIAALECAETVFIVCGIFMKPTTHKIFQECLVRECFNLTSYTDQQAALLLRVLEACRKTTPNTVPPPTQYCLHLYSTLVNSTKPEISTFCLRALLDIRLHLHCSPPSLNFALQVPQETIKDKPKKVSERNREVLESLIGKNKLPPDNIEDIITLDDEPAYKKSRLSEDADKISLSSENMSSVEISDDSDSEDVQEINVDNKSTEMVANKPIDNTEEITQNKKSLDVDSNKEISVVTGVESLEDELDKVTSPTKAVDDINGAITQVPAIHKADKEIHEASTQVPLNESNDTLDGEDGPSFEIDYDNPKSGDMVISVLEKIDDVNLPSTNETDDIQITCGQVLPSSGDEAQRKCGETELPKVNGLIAVEDNIQNINVEVSVSQCDSSTEIHKTDLSVEEMMADFVDEVQDDA
ncbi:unnamed protein product [Leptosia nina]|uniref:Proline-, glutamic acid- and leucine-rich protein 1 n=1 Tax=Leptosia nina TaxID=320188 RepID=A0AAV1JPL0_9NEOP